MPSPIKMHHLHSLTLSLWLSCEWLLLLLLLQSCPTLCDPIDSSPPGSSVPGILWARILEWVAISFSKACMQSCFSCVWLCETPWTAAHQSPLSTEFSRQEYWSELPFPSPVSDWEAAYQDSGLKVDFFLSPSAACYCVFLSTLAKTAWAPKNASNCAAKSQTC